MKKLLLLTAAMLSTIPISNATTVSFGSDAGSRTVNLSVVNSSSSDGLLRATANYSILLGTFSGANADSSGNYTGPVTWNNALTTQANISALQSSGGWSQFDGIKQNTGLNASFNSLVGSYADNTAAANPFNGKQIYVWIFNNSNSALATQVGVYTVTTPASQWVFPANAGGGTDTTAVSSETNYTFLAAAGFGYTSNSSMLQLITPVTAVPEPVTLGFAGLTALAGLVTRRRARKA